MGQPHSQTPRGSQLPRPQRLQALQDQMLQIPWDMMEDEYLICLFLLALWTHAVGGDHVWGNCKRWHNECFAPRKEDIWWTINYLLHFATNEKNHRLILLMWLLPRVLECNNFAIQFLSILQYFLVLQDFWQKQGFLRANNLLRCETPFQQKAQSNLSTLPQIFQSFWLCIWMTTICH